MSQKQTIAPAQSALKLADIYFVLFRHKWMIIVLTLISVIAAGVTFSYWQMPYRSVAQLYITAVANTSKPGEQPGDEIKVGTIGTILNSEVVIIKSGDLATNTADLVGPGRILGKDGGSTNVDDASRQSEREEAAQELKRGFDAYVLPQSTIIELVYTHPDRGVVTDVLDKMIYCYRKQHEELHNHLQAYGEELNKETLGLKTHLEEIGHDLSKLKNDGNIVDIQEARKDFVASEEQIRQEKSKAENDLAYTKAEVEELEKLSPSTIPNPATNTANATNAVATPPPDVVRKYTTLAKRVQNLQDREDQLEQTETLVSPKVRANQADLDGAQKDKTKMEDAYPGLLAVATTLSATADPVNPSSANLALELKMARAQIPALEARIKFDDFKLATLTAKGTNLNNLGDRIGDLEREKDLVQKEYDELYMDKQKASYQAMVSDNANFNIQVTENPTMPARDNKKVSKVIIGIGASGPVLALLLAFVWELVLDRSFKRPQEVMNRLKLPFFISIPNLKSKEMNPRVKVTKDPKMIPGGVNGAGPEGGESQAVVPTRSASIMPWDEGHALRPFHETLRDRLVSYFEMINLTHKPKLVAVTSCGTEAGVSTVASGLASSLSETGDGNVLLVDMNSENGEAHHFYKGQLTMGLDDILEKQKENRSSALVQENLYVVKEAGNGDKLPSILPKRFSHLVTKLKASDYDYIILDMPPVTEISVTPRLAKFMDMVLLVVEAGKTNQDTAQRAATLLTESRANVGVVMNKCRSYVPKNLCHEG